MVEYGDRVFVDCTCDRIHCLLHFVNLHFKVANSAGKASDRFLDATQTLFNTIKSSLNTIESSFNTIKPFFDTVKTFLDMRETGLDGFSQVLYRAHDASKGRLGFFPLLRGVLHASEYTRTPNDAITPLQTIRR